MGISITGGVKVPQGKFSVGLSPTGGGGGFTVNAVHFDGTNDYLTRDAALTGAMDGENMIRSLWFKIDDVANNGNTIVLDRSPIGQISTQKNTTDKLQFKIKNGASVTLYDAASDLLFNSTTNTGWHHVIIALQLDVTPVVQVFLDDVAMALTVAIGPLQGDIDFTSTDWALGATEDAEVKMTGDLAEVYMAAKFLDISIEANRRKFISAAGKPVNLGADGSTPTETVPLMFFSGATDTWHTNKGSGGGFTENGELTDAATSPSDS